MEYNVCRYLAGVRGSGRLMNNNGIHGEGASKTSGRLMNNNGIHGEGASKTSFSSQSSPFYLFFYFFFQLLSLYSASIAIK